MNEHKKEPDYQGFMANYRSLQQAGITVNYTLLTRLSQRYGTPLPGTAAWAAEFPAGWESQGGGVPISVPMKEKTPSRLN